MFVLFVCQSVLTVGSERVILSCMNMQLLPSGMFVGAESEARYYSCRPPLGALRNGDDSVWDHKNSNTYITR